MNRYIGRTFIPCYQLNNPKGYKTIGLRKKSSCFFFKKTQNVFLHTFLTHFLFKFISIAYACTFMSANHIPYNIGYFKQIGKKKSAVILTKICFYIFYKKKEQEMEIHEKKIIKNMFNR